MKRWVNYTVLIALIIAVTMCTACTSEPTLRGLVSSQEMINALSSGDIEEAWNPVYEAGAASDLKDRLGEYSELIDGREISRCDCVNYSVIGDDRGPGNYEEITQYKVTLNDQTVLYAQATCIRDENGEGIIDLQLFEESPW